MTIVEITTIPAVIIMNIFLFIFVFFFTGATVILEFLDMHNDAVPFYRFVLIWIWMIAISALLYIGFSKAIKLMIHKAKEIRRNVSREIFPP